MLARWRRLPGWKRLRGALWLVAALPMIIVPIVNDGSKALVTLGIVFSILGLVDLSRGRGP